MAKFPYPEIETKNYSGQRFYILPDNKAFPSITTVLGITAPPEKTKALENWRQSLGVVEADKRSKAAADRGTAVHLMLEQYLKGEPVDTTGSTPDDCQIFNSLKMKLRGINEIWGQEVALYSDLLEVAGRCDFIGVYKGKPCIVDFKTSTNHKDRNKIDDYYMQMAFYGAAHNEMYGTDIQDGVILMGCANGLPLEFKVKLSDYIDPLFDRVQNYYKKFAA